ncbi:MAG: hypothetical protein ABII01_06685 [Candidatus Woesearchaeota archaeon]
MNKKGKFDMWFGWPEVLSILLLIIGFILSITAQSAVMIYLLVFLSGLFFGRLWFMIQRQIKMPWSIVIFCFLLGYLLGAFLTRYGDARIIILIFVIGIMTGYYLHAKKIISSRGYA